MTAALTAEALAAMEALTAQYLDCRRAHDPDDEDAAEIARNGLALLAEVARQRDALARLTAALDDARLRDGLRDERVECDTISRCAEMMREALGMERGDFGEVLTEAARATAALDGVRREERERCKRECMVIAGELSYDFRLRQGMHAAERCAKAIGALPDDATGSAT